MASSIAQMASVVVLCMVVSAPLAQAAVTCGQVTSSVAPCIGYLTRGGAVAAPCCNGVKALNAAAKTTPDSQQTCKCLKSVASSIHGINYGFASTCQVWCQCSFQN